MRPSVRPGDRVNQLTLRDTQGRRREHGPTARSGTPNLLLVWLQCSAWRSSHTLVVSILRAGYGHFMLRERSEPQPEVIRAIFYHCGPRVFRCRSTFSAGSWWTSTRCVCGMRIYPEAHVYWGASGLPTIGTHKRCRIPPLVPTSQPHHNVHEA